MKLESRDPVPREKDTKAEKFFFKINFKINLTHGTAKRGTVTDLDEFARLKTVLLIQTKIIV